MMVTILDAAESLTFGQVATTAACMPLIFAYACRFIGISWFTTRLDVVAFNFSMLVLCGSALYRSALGLSEPLDWLGVLVAFLWLRISWPTWSRGRPPAHVITRPARLDMQPISINEARERRNRSAR